MVHKIRKSMGNRGYRYALESKIKMNEDDFTGATRVVEQNKGKLGRVAASKQNM